jgi:glycosyltransferase involved in cell wall biosynthesis/SAM-dependent methyltransferase
MLKIIKDKKSKKTIEVFFTICSKNYLAHARVLYYSLKESYPNVPFYIALCDRLDNELDPSKEPFKFIYLEDLDIPNIQDMSKMYNITEFNTSIKPYAFLYLMNNLKFKNAVYFDPDILIVSKMSELEAIIKNEAESILTPHILEPTGNYQINDKIFLQYGIYNLGFLFLKKTEKVIIFLNWWAEKLNKECLINLKEGLFVDQKWADLIPAFIPKNQILYSAGYNVAYWNLTQRKIKKIKKKWYCNSDPLRFIHFSGFSMQNQELFSRHSLDVTIENIGELNELFNYYKTKLVKENYHFYQKLSYAFNWDSSSGENLHTPNSLNNISHKFLRKLKSLFLNFKNLILNFKFVKFLNLIFLAKNIHNGWKNLFLKFFKSIFKIGFKNTFKRIIDFIYSYKNLSLISKNFITQKNIYKKIIFLDWALPKPDRDSASVTAIELMKIFYDIGYKVTFIPCNLKDEKNYSDVLKIHGINVLTYPTINSVSQWLLQNAQFYDFCIISRGPVVFPYIDLLRKYAPHTKLIFNTVDLHYLREFRGSVLNNDLNKRKESYNTRKIEYDLISKCDLTILLSKEEVFEINKNLPSSQISTLPLIFEKIPGAKKKFEFRKDILFIGGFDHQPNVDAVIFFSKHVFPLIQKKIPEIVFKIVGPNPPDIIKALNSKSGFQVLGYVKDLNKILSEVRVTLAPIRFGAGIKGKIGLSLCQGVPCVATDTAAEGMGLNNGYDILIANTPKQISSALVEVYTNKKLWSKLSVNGHAYARDTYSVSVARKQLSNIIFSLSKNWKQINGLMEIKSFAEYRLYKDRMKDIFKARDNIEEKILKSVKNEFFYTKGFCCVCGNNTKFLTSFMYAPPVKKNKIKYPNWREHLACEKCGFVNRVRAAINLLYTKFPPDQQSRIYISEKSTSTYKWLAARNKNIIGSEYFDEKFKSGTMVNNIRHEDIMNLSFKSLSFDYVLSFDVLEHVTDPIKAFNEIFRVLSKGGIFIFTVPFIASREKDKVRAKRLANGKIRHIYPPEFHGNPVNPKEGALCFRYFGWELLEQLREVGFNQVRALAYWSETQGYLGKEQFIFVAEKHL